MLELLDTVIAGKATAAQARAVIAEGASLLAARHDPRGDDVRREDAEGCRGDCEHCLAKIPELEELRVQGLEDKRRLADQAGYPYAVGTTAIHRVTCQTVACPGGLWEPRSPEVSEDALFKELLFSYTHHNSRSGIVSSFNILSPDDLVKWMEERTGPRGGTKYRLCKVCAPTPPAPQRVTLEAVV
ncbi:hypothetical protein [Streptomyces mayteni]